MHISMYNIVQIATVTCSTFSASSQPVPAITNLIDPALMISLPVPSLDLLTTAFAWWDVMERSASAFYKLEAIRALLLTKVSIS